MPTSENRKINQDEYEITHHKEFILYKRKIEELEQENKRYEGKYSFIIQFLNIQNI